MTVMLKPPRCLHTDLTIPECSCRACCRTLLRRFAPELVTQGPAESPGATARAPIYAVANRISVADPHRRSRSRQVQL